MSIVLDQNNSATSAEMAFQLKGGLFTLTTLQVYSDDLTKLKDQLLEKIQQAPNFFHSAPIVLDFKLANQPDINFDFAKLKSILSALHLIPVGIKNPSLEQSKQAAMNGFAILRDTPDPKDKNKLSNAPQIQTKSGNTKLITTPVRSGQQIYAPDGDLIVVNQVSPGAELIAEGSIHIYGPLRGRALAGINGDQQARIFCTSLEAELVSVAGNYKLSEDIEKQAWKVAAQVYIKNDRLQITQL